MPNQDGWTVEHLDWAKPENQLRKRRLNPSAGWTYHQENGVAEGMLFGGCLEVLDWLRGTPFWPDQKLFEGAILFLETSEEAPPATIVTRFIRSLAAMDVLDKLSGILLGRPGGQIKIEAHAAYAEALRRTVREEFGLTSLALVTGMDFGHTDPMFVLPQGLRARIDSGNQEFIIPLSGVSG
jgi:muramoyltetrapeptide carboxypeptidase LdcA involved in peptidoglycan recycling